MCSKSQRTPAALPAMADHEDLLEGPLISGNAATASRSTGSAAARPSRSSLAYPSSSRSEGRGGPASAGAASAAAQISTNCPSAAKGPALEAPIHASR